MIVMYYVVMVDHHDNDSDNDNSHSHHYVSRDTK